MSDLKTQKRIAAEVLNIGISRVWVNPAAEEEISQAMTRDDVRELIKQGLIQEKPKKVQTRARAKKRVELKRKRKGVSHGKRRGSAGGRKSDKEKWMTKVRAQRRELKRLKDEDKINDKLYRKYYLRIKGANYDTVKQMKEAMKTDGAFKEKK
jgi:large subunit ribosomal protein L19e